MEELFTDDLTDDTTTKGIPTGGEFVGEGGFWPGRTGSGYVTYTTNDPETGLIDNNVGAVCLAIKLHRNSSQLGSGVLFEEGYDGGNYVKLSHTADNKYIHAKSQAGVADSVSWEENDHLAWRNWTSHTVAYSWNVSDSGRPMELYTDDTIRDYDSNRLGIGKLDATMTLANSKSHGSGLDIIYKKITVCGGSCCTFASDGTNAGMYNVFRQGELSSGSRIRVRTTGCSASGPVTAACLYDMAGLYTSDEKFATSECAAIPSDAAMTDGYEEIISDDEYQVRVSGQEDVECTGEGIDYGLAGPYTVEICGIGFSPNCDPEPTCESTCEKLCQSLTPPKNFPAGSCPCDVNACVCI